MGKRGLTVIRLRDQQEDDPGTGKEAWDPSSTARMTERCDLSVKLTLSGRFHKFPTVRDILNVDVDTKEVGTYSTLVYHKGKYRGIMLVDARVVGSHKFALFDFARKDTDVLTFTTEFKERFIPIPVIGYNTIPPSIVPTTKDIMGACMQLGYIINTSAEFGRPVVPGPGVAKDGLPIIPGVMSQAMDQTAEASRMQGIADWKQLSAPAGEWEQLRKS